MCSVSHSYPTLVTAWTVACQASLSMGFPRQEYLGFPGKKWVAISFFWGSSQPRDRTWVSYIGRQILYHWAAWEGERANSTFRNKWAWRESYFFLSANSVPYHNTVNQVHFNKKVLSLGACWGILRHVWETRGCDGTTSSASPLDSLWTILFPHLLCSTYPYRVLWELG